MYPPIEPYQEGFLARPDGAEIFWEESGTASGLPALYLHGGPGGGLGAGGYRRRFDPDRFRVVGIDQRGCGRSRPWAIDDLDALDANTTAAVIEDLEAVRELLGIQRWLVHGTSWGSALGLAYAIAYSHRVAGLVLTAVTAGSRAEIDWITTGMGELFPEAWGRVSDGVPAGMRVIEWMAQRLRDPDPVVRSCAALRWDEWEATHLSFGISGLGTTLHDDSRTRENFATLVTHYWAQDCFLTGDDAILERVHRLAGIPVSLLHGRRDVSGPVATAWRLHQRLPGSTLRIVEDEGHGGPQLLQLTIEEIHRMGTALRASGPRT